MLSTTQTFNTAKEQKLKHSSEPSIKRVAYSSSELGLLSHDLTARTIFSSVEYVSFLVANK